MRKSENLKEPTRALHIWRWSWLLSPCEGTLRWCAPSIPEAYLHNRRLAFRLDLQEA